MCEVRACARARVRVCIRQIRRCRQWPVCTGKWHRQSTIQSVSELFSSLMSGSGVCSTLESASGRGDRGILPAESSSAPTCDFITVVGETMLYPHSTGHRALLSWCLGCKTLAGAFVHLTASTYFTARGKKPNAILRQARDGREESVMEKTVIPFCFLDKGHVNKP